MQTTGHIIINNEKIKLLVRTSKGLTFLKIRKTGKDGFFLDHMQNYLTDYNKEALKRLLEGETIGI